MFCLNVMPLIVWIFIAALSLRLITAWVNIGFIAIDDYDVNISRFIPYQRTSFADILDASTIRSPLPNIFLRQLAGLAHALGITSSVGQFRFVCSMLGVISMITVWAAWKHFNPQSRRRESLIAAALAGGYFLSPLFSTRILIEALGAPWLLLSSWLATRYWNDGRRDALFGAVASLALASMFRFQCGVCSLALLFCVIWRKDLKGLITLAVAGALLFAITGGLDYAARGEFHGSLQRYMSYNLRYAGEHYGTSPFYVYILLFLGLSLPPALLARYRGFNAKSEYAPLIPPLLYFLAFVGAHTAVGHKEERFMATAIPLFLVLITPLIDWTLRAPERRWRAWWFVGLNTLLLIPTSISIPQNNIVGAVRFVDRNPQITDIISAGPTLQYLFPVAFIERQVAKPRLIDQTAITGEIRKLRAEGGDICRSIVFSRIDLAMEPVLEAEGFRRVATFNPGPLEAMVVKLNPGKNIRRGPVLAYGDANCQYH